jgi:hypothetical protein
MQRPWWKHPAWIHLFAIIGAIVGMFLAAYAALLFTNITSHMNTEILLGKEGIDNGFSNLFLIWIPLYIVMLGGLCGYFITHLFGKYRVKLAPIGLIVTGVLSFIFLIYCATTSLRLMNRKDLLSCYGGYLIFSLILVVVGVVVLANIKSEQV